MNDWLGLSQGIPCVLEGNLAFYTLTEEHGAVNSIKASRHIVYQLLMLLQRAKDAQDAGEAKQRIVDKLSPVKATLMNLVNLNPNSNKKKLRSGIEKLHEGLARATDNLKRISNNAEDNKYGLPQPEMKKKDDWCADLLSNHNGKAQTAAGLPLEGIPGIIEGSSSVEDMEKEFYEVKKMPYIPSGGADDVVRRRCTWGNSAFRKRPEP